MKKCPECGKIFTDDKNFCNLDGSELVLITLSEKKSLPENHADDFNIHSSGAADSEVFAAKNTGYTENSEHAEYTEHTEQSEHTANNNSSEDKNLAAENIQFKPARITLKTGNSSAGIFFDLTSDSMIAGRFEQSTGHIDIDLSKVPNAEHISRKHAKFTFESGKWFVSDLNSTNGVFVKSNKSGKLAELSEKITEQTELNDRDEVSFGDVTFIFKWI
jgi:pSer/pThr/pTyr-binding forkhead associated (FHA) protein